MALQARVIGPESDLGHFTTLDFFGNAIGREFADVTLTAEQVEKANGNRFIELKGHKPLKAGDVEAAAVEARAEAEEGAEAETIRARLAELEVSVDGRASIKTLRTKLEAAEKAEAKRLEEAEALAQAAAEANQ